MSSLHLSDTAAALLADDKGLLAMDESTPDLRQTLLEIGHSSDRGSPARISGTDTDDAGIGRKHQRRYSL